MIEVDQVKLAIAKEVMRIFADDAKTIGATRSNHGSAVMTALRPYIHYIETGIVPRVISADTDMRTKQWLVSLEWWDVPGAIIVGQSEGRYVVKDEIRAYGGEMVRGLAGVADLIAEYGAQVGAPIEEYSRPQIMKALEQLRPTISRQGGKATMRRASACGKWWLVANIFREDALPEK